MLKRIETYSGVLHNSGIPISNISNTRCVTRSGLSKFNNVTYTGVMNKILKQLINNEEYLVTITTNELNVTPYSLNLYVDDTDNFSATYYTHYTYKNDISGSYPNKTETKNVTTDVIWSSSNTSVATVNNGKITAIGEGRSTITASYNGYTSSGTVTVEKRPVTYTYSLHINPESVTMYTNAEPVNISGYVGINGSDGNYTTEEININNVTFSSEDPDVVIVDGGRIIPRNPGNTRINASYIYNGAKLTDYITVKINETEPILQSISIEPETVEDFINGTSEVNIWAHYDKGDSYNINRYVYAGSCNTGIYNNGIITHTNIGTDTMEFSYTEAGITATTELTIITNKIPDETIVTSISVNPTSVSGDEGDISYVNILATYSDGSIKYITENTTASLSNVCNYIGGTINHTNPGTENITISYTYTNEDGLESTVTTPLKVTTTEVEIPVYLESISVDPSLVTGDEGKTSTVKVIAYYSDGTSEPVTQYTTANSSTVCSYSRGSIIHTNPGTDTITISYNGKETYLSVTTIEVPDPVYLESISVDPTSVSGDEGDTSDITVTATLSNGSTIDVTGDTWATPTDFCSYFAGTVNHTYEGSGTITINYTYLEVTKSADLSVITTKPDEIEYYLEIETPDGTEVYVGDTIKLIAKYYRKVNGNIDDNSIQYVTGDASWRSGTTSVASVNNGVVTGIKSGRSKITVTYNGETDYVNIDVEDKLTYSLYVDPQSLTMTESDTEYVSAILRTKVNEVYNSSLDENVTDKTDWISDDTSVANISGQNSDCVPVYAVGPGDAKIYAYHAGTGCSDYANVHVDKYLDYYDYDIVIDPSFVSVYVNNSVDVTVNLYKIINGDTNNPVITDITSECSLSISNTNIASVNRGSVVGITQGDTKLNISYTLDGVTYDKSIDVYVTKDIVEFELTATGIPDSICVGESFTISKIMCQKKVNGYNSGQPYDITNDCIIETDGDYLINSGSTITANYGAFNGSNCVVRISYSERHNGVLETAIEVISVTVYGPEYSLRISVDETNLYIGDTANLTATLYTKWHNHSGLPQDVTNDVKWNITKGSNCVTISNGVLTAKSVGDVELYAFYDNNIQSDYISLSVNPDYINISGGTTDFNYMGGIAKFDVDSNRSTWTATSNVDWITLDATSGSVGESILVSIKQYDGGYIIRTGTITVTARNATETITITQSGAELTAINVSPSSILLKNTDDPVDITVTAIFSNDNTIEVTNLNETSISSRNESVCTYSNGKVYYVGPGSTVIDVSYTNGSKTRTATISVECTNDVYRYELDTTTTGGVVMPNKTITVSKVELVTYINDVESDRLNVTDDCTYLWSGTGTKNNNSFTPSVAGDVSVVVSYNKNGIRVSKSLEFTGTLTPIS